MRLLAGALAGAALAAAGAGCGSSQTASSPTESVPLGPGGFQGAELPAGFKAPAFTLRDQRRRAVSLASLRGHVVVLTFLQTGCRGCALIAQQVRGALDQIGRDPTVLIVSVDPARDTPAAVARFLSQVGLTGRAAYLASPAGALPAVWRDYRLRTPAAHGQAAFEQSAPVILIDASGNERVLYGQEQLTPEALAHDIGRLQAG